MSANVFTAFGPIGQGMGPTGDASLCGTEDYPLGLTASELMLWYWMTKTVNTTCGATVEAGAVSAGFTGGVVDATPAAAFNERRTLISVGNWVILIPSSIPDFPDATAVAGLNVFYTGGTAPADKALAYDGSLWYPFIHTSGSLQAVDPVNPANSANVEWSSRVTSNPLGTPSTATILGKSVPISYSTSTTGTGIATFAAPTVVWDSDWPYT